MDDRQSQIRDRAGLEESRLNQEFIDWLSVWGPRLMFLAVILMGGYWGFRKLDEMKRAKIDRAFADFESARGRGNASPEALIAVATEFDGVKSVSTLARLEAADAYLDAVRRGVALGAQIKNDEVGRPTGELENPADELTPEMRETYLTRAESLYAEVNASTGSNDAQFLMRLNALFGLAAVAESRAQADKAKEWYEAIVKATEGTTWGLHAKIAQGRISQLGSLATFVPLPRKADVPKPPEMPQLPIPGAAAPEQAPPATPSGSPAPAPVAAEPAPAPVQPETPPTTPPATPPEQPK